jgi:UDP-glucose 4-epimerase
VKILITGCNGFVSGVFGRHANDQGHALLGLGRAASSPPGWKGRYHQSDYSAKEIQTAVRDFEPAAIFHGAGSSSVSASFEKPLEDFSASVLTWLQVLEGVRLSRLKPIVLFPSSAAVYGNPLVLPVREKATPCPISPYGFHKLAAEILAKEYALCFQLEIVSCRLFSIIGETQKRLLIWELFNQLNGPQESLELQGTGIESRDYLHIDDVASAFLQIAEHYKSEAPGGKFTPVNIARGRSITVAEVARKISAVLGLEKEILTGKDFRRGDPVRWEADVTELSRFAPQWRATDFDKSIGKCIEVWLNECSR